MDFKPTVDLHYHMDAQSPKAISAVSKKHDLELANRPLEEIEKLVQVKPGVSWNEWYQVHCAARSFVFVHPGVFKDVAEEAVNDAIAERLSVRVMRASSSMAEYCFKAKNGTSPNFTDKSDQRQFLDMLDQTIGNLVEGLQYTKGLAAPLVFSFSCQDKFHPVNDAIVDILLTYSESIAGIDLTNEQLHVLPTHFRSAVERLREGGIEALTIHVGEKNPKPGEQGYTAHERITAALSLNPDTLGHAIYAVLYPAIIPSMANSGVVVELCPHSNVYNKEYQEDVLQQGGELNLQRYPLIQFQEAGIPCTINSDTPGTLKGGCLSGEFKLVQDIFSLSTADLMELDRVARDSAKRIYNVSLE